MSDEQQKPEWKWLKETIASDVARDGIISIDAGNGSAFTVFGGREGLYFGECDAKTGDPFYPGPFVLPVKFEKDEHVETVARMLMGIWAGGRRFGKAEGGR